MTIVSRTSLAFAGMAFLLLGAALVWCIAKMLQQNRTDTLVSAPLVAEQAIQLPSTGMARLILEVPRTSADYRKVRIELTEQQSGQAVRADYSLLTAQGAVYGVTTMQVPFGPATMMRAGLYRARIGGLDAGKDYSRCRLILSRPYLGRLTLQIIILVLCGVGILLDLIWVVWLAGWMKPATQALNTRRNYEISTALPDYRGSDRNPIQRSTDAGAGPLRR